MRKTISLMLSICFMFVTVLPSFASENVNFLSTDTQASEYFSLAGENFKATLNLDKNNRKHSIEVINLDNKESYIANINVQNKTIEIDGKIYNVNIKEDKPKFNMMNIKSYARGSSAWDPVYMSTSTAHLDDISADISKTATYLAAGIVLVASFISSGPAATAILAKIKAIAASLGLAVTTNLVADLTDIEFKWSQYRTRGLVPYYGKNIHMFKWADCKLKARVTFAKYKSDYLRVRFDDSDWWSDTKPY